MGLYNHLALPCCPFTSKFTWKTEEKHDTGFGSLRLQQPTENAHFSRYLNCDYRVTWAHSVRIYQSNELHEARHYLVSLINRINDVYKKMNTYLQLQKAAKLIYCSKGYDISQEKWVPKIDAIGQYLINQKQCFPVGTVFFVTRRKLQVSSDGIKFSTSNKRSDSLIFGVASVPIDETLALNKNIPYLRLCAPSCQANPILEAFEVNIDSLITKETKMIEDMSEVVIFIHGYNSTFNSGITKANDLRNRLGIQGAMVSYCWPSNGTVGGYVADKKVVEVEYKYLCEFLDSFKNDNGNRKISIIAHSMGNRLLFKALKELGSKFQERPSISFSIISLGANISHRKFYDSLKTCYKLCDNLVVYTHAKDSILISITTIQGKQLGVVPIESFDEYYEGNDIKFKNRFSKNFHVQFKICDNIHPSSPSSNIVTKAREYHSLSLNHSDILLDIEAVLFPDRKIETNSVIQTKKVPLFRTRPMPTYRTGFNWMVHCD